MRVLKTQPLVRTACYDPQDGVLLKWDLFSTFLRYLGLYYKYGLQTENKISNLYQKHAVYDD